MRKTIDLRKLQDRNIDAPLFIVQNDGTVWQQFTVNYPIFTVASGPAASVEVLFIYLVDNSVVVT